MESLPNPMSDSCCAPPSPSADPRYRNILWIALALNIIMFGVEVAGSLRSGSVSLLADVPGAAGELSVWSAAWNERGQVAASRYSSSVALRLAASERRDGNHRTSR